jgi:hypothetical protein
MRSRLLLLCLMTVLGSCAGTVSEPPADPAPRAVKADLSLPAPETKWVARSVTQTGSSATITYTVLGEGTHQGKPVYRVSAGFDILIYDTETGNMVAVLRMGKEASAIEPHEGTFSWPLYVGKSWTARYTAHDRQRAMSVGPITVEHRVAAYEDVVVPAGSWKAFKIESESGSSSFSTIWYAPEIKLIVKRVNETTIGHPFGRTKSVYEIIEYPVKATSLKSERRPTIRAGAKTEKPEWKIGYEWRYAWKGPKGSGTLTHSILRDDVYDTIPVWVIKLGRNENFYTKDSLGLLSTTTSSGKPISRRNSPHNNLTWPLEVGKEWNSTYILERVEDKSSQKFDFRMIVTDVEDIKVPAGIFEAFKTEVYSNLNGKLVSEHWYSPKVKWFVKSKTYLSTAVREEELMDFKID